MSYVISDSIITRITIIKNKKREIEEKKKRCV